MADYKNAGAPPTYPQEPQYTGQTATNNYAPDQIHAPQQAPALQHHDSSFTQEKSAPMGATVPQQQMAGGYQTAVPISALTSGPAPIDCPACNMRQMTRVDFISGGTTWAWAAGLCFFLCLGCIPFCVSSTKNVEHHCGHCGARVATWHRSGRTEVHLHR